MARQRKKGVVTSMGREALRSSPVCISGLGFNPKHVYIYMYIYIYIYICIYIYIYIYIYIE